MKSKWHNISIKTKSFEDVVGRDNINRFDKKTKKKKNSKTKFKNKRQKKQ